MLCLFIIQRAELTEVISEDLNTVFEWQAAREVESLPLAGHGLRFLVLIVDVLIRAKRFISILIDFFGGPLRLVFLFVISG